MIRVKRLVDVEAALDSASIDLQDEHLELIVKKNKCVYEKEDLILPMAYTALGDKYLDKVINTTLKEAYLAKVATKTCSKSMKERLRKVDLTVLS